MANPKNRTSKSNSRSRRSHLAMKAPNFGVCPQCHEPKLPHIVCGNCGFYKGREVISKATE